ncbi:LapA family protein [Actinospica durhamensis]|uniref:LapA family protein n=1 Tax=Actinospica durhamensis TaxID=1508375 RepID=A0A941ERI5_9ACTN|nr:LapA family protein [Actinospica durhamensis]MBR7835776.1 LapA family protein [Actinospica durhamensis]
MSTNPANPDDQRQPLAGSKVPSRHSRLGGIWILLVLGAAILILLLVFILMNSQHVLVHLYGAHVTAPLGVALLFAAALGVLLVVVPGGGRILQLRRATKRLHSDREHLAGRLDDIAGARAENPDNPEAPTEGEQRGKR